MAKPVYKTFKAHPTEAWYQLSKEEMAQLLDKVEEAREKVGGKTVVVCNSQWSSDYWLAFGVEEFPNMEAVQQHAVLLDELNWSRYIEGDVLLGTEWED